MTLSVSQYDNLLNLAFGMVVLIKIRHNDIKRLLWEGDIEL